MKNYLICLEIYSDWPGSVPPEKRDEPATGKKSALEEAGRLGRLYASQGRLVHIRIRDATRARIVDGQLYDAPTVRWCRRPLVYDGLSQSHPEPPDEIARLKKSGRWARMRTEARVVAIGTGWDAATTSRLLAEYYVIAGRTADRLTGEVFTARFAGEEDE